MLQKTLNLTSENDDDGPYGMDDETEILRSQNATDPVGFGEVLVDLDEDYRLLGASERYE